MGHGVSSGFGLGPTVAHRLKLDDIERSCELIGHQRDRVLKIAITPWKQRALVAGRRRSAGLASFL